MFPRMESDSDHGVSAVELLKRTPIDRLEETVQALKRHRPAAEVRKALVERLAHAPLSDFESLKHIYLKHCGDAVMGSRRTRSYSAMTCAPRRRTMAPISTLRSTMIDVVSEPYTSWIDDIEA